MLYMQEVVEMPEVQYKVDLPAFTGRNVPIKEIAQAMGKDGKLRRLIIYFNIIRSIRSLNQRMNILITLERLTLL